MIRVLQLVFLAAIALLWQGCAGTGGATLKIDARHVMGLWYMPDELSSMLRDLGFEWIPIVDPETEHEVKMVQQDGAWRMRFEFVKTAQARIDARIRMQDGLTRLHFYEPGSQTLSASSKELLRKLQIRATQEFGKANVSY